MGTRKKKQPRHQGVGESRKDGRHTRVPPVTSERRSIDYWVATAKARST